MAHEIAAPRRTDRPSTRRTAKPLHVAAAVAAALLAAASLVAGVGGGLVRIGAIGVQGAGPAGPAAAAWHGAVMVCGLFGTLIALERAVALRHGRWVPLAAGAGALAAWLGAPPPAPLAAWVVAGVGLVALYVHAGHTRAWSFHLAVELAGAATWLAGTLAWTVGARDAALVGWCGFLMLTIAGERRELTQMLRLPRWASVAFVGIVALVPLAFALAAAGAAVGAAWAWWGACAGLALWLLRFDIAPRQWRAGGWAGHTAWCLIAGYAWLLVAAAAGLVQQRVDGAALHLLLLGFVFAMVFGHAPIILPALTGLRPRYSRWARLPLLLMAASLVARLLAETGGETGLRAAAGWGHAAAIAWFAATMLHATWRARGAAR
ncbi:hypothetical protein [Azohydromonas sediminis]|uniref:hypothetical protein n=1 Tax=Azohydromonas sediminis TaxID=2259674 RepID=UPI0013C2DE32|nr:hypothetical protein [Azohydromonas sediminis]